MVPSPHFLLALANNMLSPPRLLVDKCTPRDRYARTHIPLSTSLCPSADDSLVPGVRPIPLILSPHTLTALQQTLAPSVARRRAHSSSDSQGWKLLPTPIRPTFRPRDYELPPCVEDDDRSDAQTISLKVLRRSLKNVEFDPSCLDCLDQQTLLSPTESFSEVCYTEATHDPVHVPILQPLQPRIRKRTALYDRTAMSEEDPYHDWDENLSVRWSRPLRKPVRRTEFTSLDVACTDCFVSAPACPPTARTSEEACGARAATELSAVCARGHRDTFTPGGHQPGRVCTLFPRAITKAERGVWQALAGFAILYLLHALEVIVFQVERDV